MGAQKPFGRTWWGNAWVKAMERIDYNTNRLPRGRRYANNGSVRDIQIQDGEVHAIVQGSRPKPYRVRIKLNEFRVAEAKRIKAIIADNIAVATELSLGRLPESMLDLLEKGGIHLLPHSWNEISASCSCPDWANPCKHLAAVYYIIGNEIDKNPFILFNLKGMATEDLCAAGGILPAGSNDTREDRQDYYIPYDRLSTADLGPHEIRGAKADDGEAPALDMDLTFPGVDVDALYSLLPDSPLFYPQGNFKKLLIQTYHWTRRSVENLAITDDEATFHRTEIYLVHDVHGLWSFTSPPHERLGQTPGAKTKYVKIPTPKDGQVVLGKKKGIVLPAAGLFDLFLGLPLDMDPQRQSPSAAFLSLCSSIALALVHSSSFIPEVVAEEGGRNFTVRYVPLTHDEKIENAIALARSLMPPIFAVRTLDGTVLAPEGINHIISLILTHIVNRFSEAADVRDKVCSAFFKGRTYMARAFEESNTAKSISDWLAGLTTRKHDISPVIRLELLADDRFALHLDVENKKDGLAPLLPLAEIFRKDTVFSQPAVAVRTEVARQIAVAAGHLPQLQPILNSKGAYPAEIDAEGMASFMTRTKALLDLLGIRMLVPKELKQLATPRLAVRARVKGKAGSVSYLSLQKMLDFSWEISLGDQRLSKSEFLNLVKSAHGVVRFRDHYLLLSPEEVKGILERLRKPPRELSAMEALCSAVTGEHDGMLFNADDALQKLVKDLAKVEDIALPAALTARLRPYQERGFRWLCSNAAKGFGSCMADDMGLGKTIQVIAFLLKLKDDGGLSNPALVVCPTTIVGNWEKECRRFAPSLNVSIYHGSERSLTVKNRDLVITTYGILRREIDKFSHREWRAVIVDEAQNIKNPDTDQARAIKSLKAGVRIAMSGTPVENRLAELWSIFDFINGGYLGQARTFQTKYAVPIEKYRDKGSIERLRTATAPFILRRLKKDKSIIEDLPDKIVSDEYCYLTKEQAALYQRVVDSTMETIEGSEGIQRKGLIFKLITSLKQICNHPVHYSKKGEPRKEESGKAEKIIDLAGKILSLDQKALVFTQYREMGDLLSQLFARELREEVLFFHGGLARKKRDAMIEGFQERDSGGIMVISLKAGGTGLNLTSAGHVIHYDLWWNPAVEDQATDRAYRIGQTKDVMVHRLITLGTFEEKINEMLISKKELADLTVAAGEQWLTELSDRELKDLFSLAG